MAPGIAVQTAMHESHQREPDDASLEAIVESGVAAVAAGSVETGVRSLRTAVGLADARSRTGGGWRPGCGWPRR